MKASRIFEINSDALFKQVTLDVFQYQYENSPVYRRFCNMVNRNPGNITDLHEIPFLPIEFFKSHKIVTSETPAEMVFTSSGTTGMVTSKHYVHDLKVYEHSFLKAFEIFYGPIEDLTILALLPSYLERKGSSLIYMAESLIKRSNKKESGFYLHNLKELRHTLQNLEERKQKTLLIGVSFALLDLVETYTFELQHTIVMETGGMKGRRKEMIRKELHERLSLGFGVDTIHSEYGMTELLSQAYSKGHGIFDCPPWMKMQIRDPEDPFSDLPVGKTGGLNVIDLANINSCSFIATQDLGKINASGQIEILGRFDHSDIRGCNLLIL